MQQNTWITLGVGTLAVGVLAAGGYLYAGKAAAPKAVQHDVQAAIVPKPAPARAIIPVSAKPAAAYTQNGEYDNYYNADGAYVYDRAAPPLPPDAYMLARRKPRDEFSGRVTQSPLLHRGRGTQRAPMVWTARTSFGGKRRANLTFTAFVPEPGKGAGPAFWRTWYGHTNIAPRVTQGTHVVVAGDVAARVMMDPANLDLQKDALLRLKVGGETRVYHSSSVHPAEGRVWAATGVVWTYRPDAEFYRLLRAHAAVSLIIPYDDGRSTKPVAIPFSMRGFASQARAFDRNTRKRLAHVAKAWETARANTGWDRKAEILHELDKRPLPGGRR